MFNFEVYAYLIKVKEGGMSLTSRRWQRFFGPSLLDFGTLCLGGQLLIETEIKFVIIEPWDPRINPFIFQLFGQIRVGLA